MVSGECKDDEYFSTSMTKCESCNWDYKPNDAKDGCGKQT